MLIDISAQEEKDRLGMFSATSALGARLNDARFPSTSGLADP